MSSLHYSRTRSLDTRVRHRYSQPENETVGTLVEGGYGSLIPYRKHARIYKQVFKRGGDTEHQIMETII